LVQSDQPAAFDPDTIAILQTTTDQVAVALDNARLFAQSQEALEATRRAYGELSRQAWTELLRVQPDLSLRKDRYGISLASDAWKPQMEAALKTGKIAPTPDEATALAAPIKVRGQVIGVINARKPGDTTEWTLEEVTLLETLTEQLGMALDSARLHQAAQQRAARERLTREVVDNIRAAVSVEDAMQRAVQELGRVLGVTEMVARIGTERDLLSSVSGNGDSDTPGGKA
jgi:GAF domain-containing protein